MRLLDNDQTARLFETKADDTGDKPVKMPFISLSRGKDFEILSNIKQEKSFNGLKIMSHAPLGSGLNGPSAAVPGSTPVMNVIPIKVTYSLDI